MNRFATSVFGALLYLYPASFREEYGREMARLLADRFRNSDSGADALFIWVDAIAGVLIDAPREHLSLLHSDSRHALRTLRQAKWFTATALVTLALGIGANTAIFSVVETLLLRQLPYRDPDRIVMVWVTNPEQGFDRDVTSYPRLQDWRSQSTTIEGFAAYSGRTRALTGSGDPQHVRGSMVTANFFDVMGVKPLLGAGFSQGDDDFGQPHKVLLSHGLWVRQFGGNPGIVGETVTLDGQLYIVTGVMPSTFRFPTRETEFWEPLVPDRELRAQRGTFWLNTVGRLKPGVTLAQGQREMDGISRRLAAEHREDQSLGVALVTLQDELTATTRPALFVLAIAVGFVLLIACANVAGMLIARASDRQREMSLRSALGAGRGRVIRQLLTEAVVLFVIGGTLGLAVAAAGIRAIIRFAPADITQIRDVQMNWTVAAYAIGLAVATGLLFGAAPAVHAARCNLADALRSGSRQAGGQRGATWFRTGLLAAEVALAFVLLTGAGLFLRSFAQMQAVDLGFDPRNVVAARLDLPRARYDSGVKSNAFLDALLARVRATPGVESAEAVTTLLLDRLPNSAGFQIEGRPQDISMPLTYDSITPGFFATIKTPLLKGRFFSAADSPTAPPVTIINATTAKRYWPNQDPLGKRIRFGAGSDNTSPWITIVGVVGDTKRAGIDSAVFTESYQPLQQSPALRLSLLVRTRTPELNVASALKAAVRELDPLQPVAAVAPVQSLLDETVAARRFSTLLVTIFAVAALVLAAVGVYGLLAYIITLQQHEIGIRIALGASAGRIVKVVGRHAIGAACAGSLVGILASLVVSQSIARLLYGIDAIDAPTYAGAIAVLVAVVAAAAIFPLKRALNVDPAALLRAE